MHKRNSRNAKLIFIVTVLLIAVSIFIYWKLCKIPMTKYIIRSTDISTYVSDVILESAKVKLNENDYLHKLEKRKYNLQRSGYVEYVFVISTNDKNSFIANNEILLSYFGFLDEGRDLFETNVENTGYYCIGNKLYFVIANRDYPKLIGIDEDYRIYCQELLNCFELIFNNSTS